MSSRGDRPDGFTVVLADALFALATALFLAILFAVGFASRTSPLSRVWFLEFATFFVIVLCATWASSVWLRKSPAVGLAAPYVAAILIAAIFLLAGRQRERWSSEPGALGALPGAIVMRGVLFIVLLVVLLVLIIVGYNSPG